MYVYISLSYHERNLLENQVDHDRQNETRFNKSIDLNFGFVFVTRFTVLVIKFANYRTRWLCLFTTANDAVKVFTSFLERLFFISRRGSYCSVNSPFELKASDLNW